MTANRQTGRTVTSSIWDSAAEREASESALREFRQKARHIAGAQEVKVELYESVYEDMSRMSTG